jgi:hypothetical protein
MNSLSVKFRLGLNNIHTGTIRRSIKYWHAIKLVVFLTGQLIPTEETLKQPTSTYSLITTKFSFFHLFIQEMLSWRLYYALLTPFYISIDMSDLIMNKHTCATDNTTYTMLYVRSFQFKVKRVRAFIITSDIAIWYTTWCR